MNADVDEGEDEDEDEGAAEEVVVVSDNEKSFLYLIHIAGAGIISPVNVNVLVKPLVSPSPVYATVVMTVESMLEAQNVDDVPPNTAGVCGLKPGSQQKAVVSAFDTPTMFFSHPLGQIPGE